MRINIDEIIDKCIYNVLFETKNNTKILNAKDNALNNIQQHFRTKLDNGDQDLIQHVKNMGYGNNSSVEQRREQRKNAYGPNFTVSNFVNDDIKRVINILKEFTNEDGTIGFKQLKDTYPDEYYEIMRLKNFIDRNGLAYLYDKNANIPGRKYGTGVKGDVDKFDFNKITKGEINTYRNNGADKTLQDDEILYLMHKKIVDNYLKSKYGMSLDVPDIDYSLGNQKLPNDTLIVNFTSAMNCPAWNECLLKHSCYARNNEKMRDNVFRANENKGLYWIASQGDSELLKYMLIFIRTCVFNYEKITKELKKKKLIKSNITSVMLSEYDLSSELFTPEIIEVMMRNKIANKIRLNENGDFLGQWLVDAWDVEAGKYSKFGITVSAYTCRNFNYSAIKNIVLNVSRTLISKNGNNKNGISRHFIALPENVYNSLDETYSGANNSITLIKGNVNPNPQKLYDVVIGEDGRKKLKANGKMYYKCPCDRTFGKEKINCYQCQLCYTPKNTDSEMFVFVKAHGTLKGAFKGYDLIKNRIGVSKNFFKQYKDSMNESIEQRFNVTDLSNEGIKSVTNNAIHSLYEHMSNIGGSSN